MLNFSRISLAALALLIASPVFAGHHCTCDDQCMENCAKGKTEDCKCKDCHCSKGKDCKHGKCHHHNEKETSKE